MNDAELAELEAALTDVHREIEGLNQRAYHLTERIIAEYHKRSIEGLRAIVHPIRPANGTPEDE